MTKRFIALAIFVLISLPLFSCYSGEELIESISDGDYSFEFYGEDDIIRTVSVKKNGKNAGKFKLEGKDPVIADLNFDGYNDLKIVDNKNKGHYICYIYQAEVGVFSLNSVLGAMLNPVWDNESKTIKSQIYDKVKTTEDESDAPAAFKETKGEALWEWQGGVPVKLSETGLEYFSDSGLFCYYRCALVNGECLRDNAADKWYYYDELEKAGLSWKMD